jgi:hypothetical protein
MTANFFLLDRTSFLRAAHLGFNEAIAYIVQARGTGPDNRTTQWSATAVTARTGISRRNAGAAVANLVKNGLTRFIRPGRHPIYELSVDQPAWAWLPNAVVDGAADEIPPLELIRQCRNGPALVLFVGCYGAYAADAGGIPLGHIRTVFDRVKVGEQGEYVVWGFSVKHITADSDPLVRPFLTGKMKKKEDGGRRDEGWDVFWPAWHTLTDIGLMQRVGLVMEGGDNQAEPLHPYGMRGGEPEEIKLGLAAHAAGAALLTEGQRQWAEDQGLHLLPTPRHLAQVTMIEVARPLYRVHNRDSAAWYASMQETTARWITQYEPLASGQPTISGAKLLSIKSRA